MRYLIIVLVILFGTPACLKDAIERETMLPDIKVNTPLHGQIFTPGQSIPVSGTITENNFISKVHINISNINTRATLMDVRLYPARSNTTFNQSITAIAGINYKILVSAEDKAGNYARNSVEVSCN